MLLSHRDRSTLYTAYVCVHSVCVLFAMLLGTEAFDGIDMVAVSDLVIMAVHFIVPAYCTRRNFCGCVQPRKLKHHICLRPRKFNPPNIWPLKVSTYTVYYHKLRSISTSI